MKALAVALLLCILPQLATANNLCLQIFSSQPSQYREFTEDFAQKILKAPAKGFLNKRRYKKYLNNMALKSLAHHRSPEQLIFESYNLLTKISSSQKASTQKKTETPLTEWVQREAFRHEVFKHLDTIPTVLKDAGAKGAIARLKRFFQNPAVSFILDPTKLPFLRDKPIPERLLEKIILDGLKPHRKELEEFYQLSGQQRRLTYRQAATIYRIVALTGSAILLAILIEELPEKNNEMQKEALSSQLDQATAGLEALNSLLDAELNSFDQN